VGWAGSESADPELDRGSTGTRVLPGLVGAAPGVGVFGVLGPGVTGCGVVVPSSGPSRCGRLGGSGICGRFGSGRSTGALVVGVTGGT
jgi:hypothetical protein